MIAILIVVGIIVLFADLMQDEKFRDYIDNIKE